MWDLAGLGGISVVMKKGESMKPVKEIKKVQVEGKKYLMPAEDADIEKLIQKGLRLKSKVDAVQVNLTRYNPGS